MSYGFSYTPSSLLWIPVLLLGVPLLLWIGFASTLARRNAVDRTNRIAEWYGYSVCLVAVVVLLFSTVSVVNSVFTLANPLHGEDDFGPALSSFQAYRATYQRSPFLDEAEREALRRAPPGDAELRERYAALRADREQRNRFGAWRSLVTGGLLSVFATLLFLLHWRWLQRVAAGPAERAGREDLSLGT
jgi:hypothetical protein